LEIFPEVDPEISAPKWYWMSACRRGSHPYASQSCPSKERSMEH